MSHILLLKENNLTYYISSIDASVFLTDFHFHKLLKKMLKLSEFHKMS